MKLLNLKTVMFVALIVCACSTKKEQHSSDADEAFADSVAENEVPVMKTEQEDFAGEYLIGDGDMYIVPVADTYEIQDGTGTASDVLYFQGKESDTLSVYANKDKTVIFKMNPGHQTGKYHADGEQLPVERVGPLR